MRRWTPLMLFGAMGCTDGSEDVPEPPSLPYRALIEVTYEPTMMGGFFEEPDYPPWVADNPQELLDVLRWYYPPFEDDERVGALKTLDPATERAVVFLGAGEYFFNPGRRRLIRVWPSERAGSTDIWFCGDVPHEGELIAGVSAYVYAVEATYLVLGEAHDTGPCDG